MAKDTTNLDSAKNEQDVPVDPLSGDERPRPEPGEGGTIAGRVAAAAVLGLRSDDGADEPSGSPGADVDRELAEERDRERKEKPSAS